MTAFERATPTRPERLEELLGQRARTPDERLDVVLFVMADLLDPKEVDDYGSVLDAAEHGAAHAVSVGLVTQNSPPRRIMAELLAAYWLNGRASR